MATSLSGQSGMKIPKGYGMASIPNMSPESYNFWKQALSQVQPGALSGIDLLGKMAQGDESTFEGIEKPYYSALQKMGGQLGSRFAGGGGGPGSMSALRSSGFRNSLAGAAGDLSEQLGSQRLGLQQNAVQQLLALSDQLLGKQPYQYGLVQKQPSAWQQLAGALGQGLGTGIGAIPGMFNWSF